MTNNNYFLCPKCKGRLTVGIEFCNYCAFDLSLANIEITNEPTHQYSVTANPNEVNFQYQTASSYTQSSNGTMLGVSVATTFGIFVFAAIGIVVGVIYWSVKGSNESIITSPSTYKSPGSNSTPSKNYAANNSDYQLGKTGRLTTNLRLRSASNKNARIIGVHYQNAKVRVLELESYDTVDGYSTWFRVQVLENGCDAEGKLGCGHEGGTEGWMNSKYIVMD